MGKRSRATRKRQRLETYGRALRARSCIPLSEGNYSSANFRGRTSQMPRYQTNYASVLDRSGQLSTRSQYPSVRRKDPGSRTTPSPASQHCGERELRNANDHVANLRLASDVGWTSRREVRAPFPETTKAPEIQVGCGYERFSDQPCELRGTGLRSTHRERSKEGASRPIDSGNNAGRHTEREPTLHRKNATRLDDAAPDPHSFRRGKLAQGPNSGDSNRRPPSGRDSTSWLDEPEYKYGGYSTGHPYPGNDHVSRNHIQTERISRKQNDGMGSSIRYLQGAQRSVHQSMPAPLADLRDIVRYSEPGLRGNHRPSATPPDDLRYLQRSTLDEPKDIAGNSWEAEIDRLRPNTAAANITGKLPQPRPMRTSIETTYGSPAHVPPPYFGHEARRRAQVGVLWNTSPPGNSTSRCDRANDTSPTSIVCNNGRSYTNDRRGKCETKHTSSEWLSTKMTADDWRQLRYNALIDGSGTEKLAFKLLQEIVLSHITGLPVPTLKCVSDVLNTLPQTQHQEHTMVDMADIPAELRAALPALSLTRPSGAEPSSRFQNMTLRERGEPSVNQSGYHSVAQGPTNAAGSSETAQSDAMSNLADNLLYFFEGGSGQVTNPANKLGAGLSVPVRGRVADRHMLPRSMRERRMVPKFEDNVELDPLFQSLQMALCGRRSHAQR